VRSYLDEIRRVDIGRVDGTDRDPNRVRRLLASLGRNTATYATIRTLAADAGGADGGLAESTVRDYLAALERLMITEDQTAWAPHLRSKSRLRTASKRHFVDPSLAVAALGETSDTLLRDLQYFGFVFESMVVRDLRVHAQAMDAEILQYQDNTGLEVDAIVRARDGRWCALEVKLGHGQADEAAAALLRFRDRVDIGVHGAPAALAVVVGTGYSYVRDDGVAVISIGTLGPWGNLPLLNPPDYAMMRHENHRQPRRRRVAGGAQLGAGAPGESGLRDVRPDPPGSEPARGDRLLGRPSGVQRA
jgi:hypothetical protein